MVAVLANLYLAEPPLAGIVHVCIMKKLLRDVLLPLTLCEPAGIELSGTLHYSAHLEMCREATLVIRALVKAFGIIGASQLEQLQVPLGLSIEL